MSDRERGQLTMDFAIGTSLFLIVVTLALGLFSGLFDPFVATGDAGPIVADRAAAQLSTDVLGDPARPNVLNSTCTAAFFAGTTPDDCRFDTADSHELLGVGEFQEVNVTVRDPDTNAITELNGTPLRTGPSPRNRSDVATARRLVSVDDGRLALEVRIW